MASTREIRKKVASIVKTQKITSAMQAVAASKMHKTQKRRAASLPYALKIREVIEHLAASSSDYRHPYMQHSEEVTNSGIIIISSDRGLCGSLNVNLFREVVAELEQWDKQGVGAKLCLVGRRAEIFFKRFKQVDILGAASHLGDAPSIESLIGAVNVMLQSFAKGEIQRLYVAFNQFVTTMEQRPRIVPLLPLPAPEEKTREYQWDYIYEPSQEALLGNLLNRYIEFQVYQATVENIACEQAAKMLAMQSASDNAGELIKQFQLAYNKARQAAITQELSEIVGGADAL